MLQKIKYLAFDARPPKSRLLTSFDWKKKKEWTLKDVVMEPGPPGWETKYMALFNDPLLTITGIRTRLQISLKSLRRLVLVVPSHQTMVTSGTFAGWNGKLIIKPICNTNKPPAWPSRNCEYHPWDGVNGTLFRYWRRHPVENPCMKEIRRALIKWVHDWKENVAKDAMDLWVSSVEVEIVKAGT
ncbi:Uu.00g074790.m01.CDS01 [Anthostomella pinea]|uniref:Uu.00g074790.m01.CDS01 n=1 Tax=Anthostomella pinea TaxID=933095 RepID=A0AAI8YNY8_9PEZI|nr:Uu.00g074790.m01.CDS01 [Anthostomella pinea]